MEYHKIDPWHAQLGDPETIAWLTTPLYVVDFINQLFTYFSEIYLFIRKTFS
jgi:hypothetical protein